VRACVLYHNCLFNMFLSQIIMLLSHYIKVVFVLLSYTNLGSISKHVMDFIKI
jgi:hypothetical protein